MSRRHLLIKLFSIANASSCLLCVVCVFNEKRFPLFALLLSKHSKFLHSQLFSLIIREAYRVLDNHRVFVFNVGDIFDNDNIQTTSTWGKRRIPLGAYFTKIFEEEGFTFVDDFIWDKGEVQSERHKNGNKPFPFYQYPMNCYEHILIFHKHRKDERKFSFHPKIR